MNAMIGGSVYETWVITLRAWAKDPQTSLDELPPLDADTFTPATYQRLIKHLVESNDAASKRWIDALLQAFDHSATPNELASQLVALRPVLARRSQLASHPSLPPEVREALEDSLRRDIDRTQQEMEDAIRRSGSSARLDTEMADRMLQVVRENSFKVVVDQVFADDAGRLEVAPLPHVNQGAPDTRRRFRPHRIVNAPTDSVG